MNKSVNFKRLTALILALMLTFLTACSVETGSEEPSTGDSEDIPVITYGDTTENVKKSENIYVNLDSTGAARKITVSDWLHADRGNVKITDSTTLRDFVITRGQAASVHENGTLTWHMTTSDVYYEGASDKQLPINISIKYYLEEQEITPEELAGKSGNFKMEVTMQNNVSQEVEINGQKITMYTPMMVVGGMMLPYENFTNIEVTNGISVGGGSYEAIVLAGAPGLNESLGLSQLNISGFQDFSFPNTFTITATVTDFKLADAYYAAMPLASLNMDIELPKTLEDVKNILNEIQDIQGLLAQIDPNNVVAQFMSDTQAVKEMLDIMQKGLKVYNENQKMLTVMSEQLTPENIAILTEFLNSLDASEMQSLLNMMSNVPGLQSMMNSLLDLSNGLDEVMPILESFSAALEDPEVAASMAKLPETLATLTELMNYLNENKELLDVLTALMASENINELTGVLDGMASSSVAIGNTDMSQLSVDAETLVLRMEEWMKFNYRIYTSAPDYMTTSCMFIYKTDPINPA